MAAPAPAQPEVVVNAGQNSNYRGPRFSAQDPQVYDRTLWMGDIPGNWDANFVMGAFSNHGISVSNIKLIPASGDRKTGFAFVEFVDENNARKAMLYVNGRVVDRSDPPVYFNLAYANSTGNSHTEYNLFVSNLPLDVDDAELFKIFGERYSKCRGAKVYRNLDGSSKGNGIVRFSDQTEQQMALLEMHKHKVHGTQIIVKLGHAKVFQPRANQAPRGGEPQRGMQGGYGQMPMQGYYQQPPQVLSQPPYGQPVGGYMNVGVPLPNMSVPPPRIRPPSPPVPVTPITAEEERDYYLMYGDEIYEAMEESRWSRVIFDVDTTESEMVHALKAANRKGF